MPQIAATNQAPTDSGVEPMLVKLLPVVVVRELAKKITSEMTQTTQAPIYQRVVVRLLTCVTSVEGI